MYNILKQSKRKHIGEICGFYSFVAGSNLGQFSQGLASGQILKYTHGLI